MDAVQAAVFARTPIGARRIRYVGAADDAFSQACIVRNPHCDVLCGAADPASVEALAADDLGGLLSTPAAEALIAAADVVVASTPAGCADLDSLLHRLEALGFEVLHLQPLAGMVEVTEAGAFFNDIQGDLTQAWRAGRIPAPAPERLIVVARRRGGPALMHLSMLSFAPRFMDIRTSLPAMAMRSEPDLLVEHFRPPTQMAPGLKDQPKILVLQRPAAPKSVEAWKRSTLQCVENGWISVIEFDDHPWLTAKTAGRPVQDTDWVRFSGVHAVQTSTPLLGDLLRKFNPETRVFPNALFGLEAFPENLPKRVFYGAIDRGDHAAKVAAALAPAIAQFPGVEFVVVGDRSVFEALPTAHKRFHEMVPYEDYLKLMGGCAISLSPLEDNEQNAAKSDAKFLDAASRGVLTIASRVVYGEVIRHGENGLIAEKLEDWPILLAGALADDAARREMARRAWSYVRDQRMFADQARERIAWYRDLWARREELDAAVLARL